MRCPRCGHPIRSNGRCSTPCRVVVERSDYALLVMIVVLLVIGLLLHDGGKPP